MRPPRADRCDPDAELAAALLTQRQPVGRRLGGEPPARDLGELAGTYDPKYESSYWLRFILGLMAGLLLALLVPVSSGEGSTPLDRPVLALLGGFSAAVLYRILERLVAGVESIVQADSRQLRVAEREAAEARATIDAARDRLTLVAELRNVQDRARAGSPSSEVADALDDVLEGLLPTQARDSQNGSAPPAALPGPAGERPEA